MCADKDEPEKDYLCRTCRTWCEIEPPFLNEEELEKLPTNRLLSILRGLRAITSAITHYEGHRHCEECHEYMGDDYEKEVVQVRKPYRIYFQRVKKVLAKREHIPRPLSKAQKEVLDVLKKYPGLPSRDITFELYPKEKGWKRKEHMVSKVLTELENKKLIDRGNRPCFGKK